MNMQVVNTEMDSCVVKQDKNGDWAMVQQKSSSSFHNKCQSQCSSILLTNSGKPV